MKPPSKYEVFSHGLSCVFDFETSITTVFLAGEFIASSLMANEEPTVRLDIIQDVFKHLEAYSDYWTHPLLVPTILCSLHLTRMNTYTQRSLTKYLTKLEDELNMTRVGRRNSTENLQSHKTPVRYRHEDDPIIPEALIAKDEAMRLTIRINTQAARLLVAKVSPGWTKNASESILECLQDHAICDTSSASIAIKERLKVNIHLATCLENYLDSLQARLTLQLNVLYSFIAQTDNQYSARLAELSGRDSASMKILAFITTIFLPCTFVATMFSMDMFSWRHDPAPGASPFSSQFWIYWW